MAGLSLASALLLSVLPLAASAGQVHLRTQPDAHQATIEIAPDAVQHTLSICNGFAFMKSLDITYLRTQQSLTGNSPLKYKQCKQWALPLQEGDQLDFKADAISVGTFHVTGLPRSASNLLLITRRRNPHTMALAFQSHTYSESSNAQIAVLDAYGANNDGSYLKITDSSLSTLQTKDGEHKQKRSEALSYNSVTLLAPGQYDLVLFDADGQNISSAPLQVHEQGKYVAVRMGADEDAGSSQFPMELVVYPKSAACGVTCLKMLMAVVLLAIARLP
mmetsp:Transcript_72034/g.134664  ORF Transcript_72034/g.134664 Transcript_72034/m.134664 type:complete len:276 (+) Transcript_72034:53-880(+)